MLININKRTYVLDFAVPMKLNESEKLEKYLDQTKELKKLWNM